MGGEDAGSEATLPIRVLFDTSSLLALNPQGVSVRVLRELVREGTLCLYIPTIVESELHGQLIDSLIPPGRDFARAAEWAPDAERSLLLGYLRDIEQIISPHADLMKRGVTEWLNQLSVERVRPDPADTDFVFTLYFEGSSPFKKPRSRADLPDGFIFAAVHRLAASTNQGIHVVCADKRLGDACARLPGVRLHRGLPSVLTLPEIAPESSAARIRDYVRQHCSELLPRLEPILGEAVLDRELTSAFFPSDNNEATITGFGAPQDITLDLEALEVISDQAVVLPAECLVTGNLADLFIFKADYYCLGEEAHFSVADPDWNDHYLLAQTQVDVELQCTLTVEVKKLDDERYAFGDIEVSEVDDLTVVDPF
jgi:hypothetical protein